MQGLKKAKLAKTAEPVLGKHEMIQHVAAHCLCRNAQLPCGVAIRLAGTEIAARMIMSQQEARSAVQRRIPDDGPQGEIGAAGVAFVAGQVEAIGLTIDVRHPQALSSGIGLGKAAREEGAGRLGSVQLKRLCGTLIAYCP